MTDVLGLDGDPLGRLKPEDGPIVAADVACPLRPPTFIEPGYARVNPFIPHVPTEKQRLFLMLAVLEAFYGGAAGGGKSDALLIGALQFVDVPGYAALLLRRTYKALSQPGGLMHRARLWLRNTAATWREETKTWTFPSGATLTFGYIARDADVEQYQGGEYQFIGIDESTQLSPYQYRYLFSRMRRPSADSLAMVEGARSQLDGLDLAHVPIRFRAGANPGGDSHAFHKRRLVDHATRRAGVFFIPAKLEDNPFLDKAEYEQALQALDPINWQRLRQGDWETRDPGEIFDATKIVVVERRWPGTEVEPRYERCRRWDMAASEVKPNTDPDWTVGFRLAIDKLTGLWRIEHIVRWRAEPSKTEELMGATAEWDGRYVPQIIEQEPGSEGKAFISYTRRHTLRGWRVFGDRPTGAKELRIRQLEPLVNGGDCTIVDGPYVQPFADEVDAWPNGLHDDQLDAFAGAHRWLTRGGRNTERR